MNFRKNLNHVCGKSRVFKRKMNELKSAIKKNEEAIKAHSVRVAELMKNHEHGILTTTTDKLLVDFVTEVTKRVSSDYLKKEHPDIYQEALKASKSRRSR